MRKHNPITRAIKSVAMICCFTVCSCGDVPQKLDNVRTDREVSARLDFVTISVGLAAIYEFYTKIKKYYSYAKEAYDSYEKLNGLHQLLAEEQPIFSEIHRAQIAIIDELHSVEAEILNYIDASEKRELLADLDAFLLTFVDLEQYASDRDFMHLYLYDGLRIISRIERFVAEENNQRTSGINGIALARGYNMAVAIRAIAMEIMEYSEESIDQMFRKAFQTNYYIMKHQLLAAMFEGGTDSSDCYWYVNVKVNCSVDPAPCCEFGATHCVDKVERTDYDCLMDKCQEFANTVYQDVLFKFLKQTNQELCSQVECGSNTHPSINYYRGAYDWSCSV